MVGENMFDKISFYNGDRTDTHIVRCSAFALHSDGGVHLHGVFWIEGDSIDEISVGRFSMEVGPDAPVDLIVAQALQLGGFTTSRVKRVEGERLGVTGPISVKTSERGLIEEIGAADTKYLVSAEMGLLMLETNTI